MEVGSGSLFYPILPARMKGDRSRAFYSNDEDMQGGQETLRKGEKREERLRKAWYEMMGVLKVKKRTIIIHPLYSVYAPASKSQIFPDNGCNLLPSNC